MTSKKNMTQDFILEHYRILFHHTQNICGYHKYFWMSAAFHDMYLTTVIMIWLDNDLTGFPLAPFPEFQLTARAYPAHPNQWLPIHSLFHSTRQSQHHSNLHCGRGHTMCIQPPEEDHDNIKTRGIIIHNEGDNDIFMTHSSSSKIKTKITNLFL